MYRDTLTLPIICQIETINSIETFTSKYNTQEQIYPRRNHDMIFPVEGQRSYAKSGFPLCEIYLVQTRDILASDIFNEQFCFTV